MTLRVGRPTGTEFDSDSRSAYGRNIVVLGMVLLTALSSACLEQESANVEKIGRYEFHAFGAGLEIRESSTGLSRLLDSLFGRTSQVKIRLDLVRGGDVEYASADISQVIVRKRRLKGPAAKPTASRRPYEVRLMNQAGDVLPPFFYFGSEVEARAFATRFEQALGRED